VLYVEGARDRDLLRIWAQRHSMTLSPLVRSAVILGGRQPHRAVEHFRGVRATEREALGLCVLDRDHASAERPGLEEPGLDFFVWSRRHIESYLLVPEAIRRTVLDRKDRFRLERFLREQLPPRDDEAAYRKLDAKRLLGRDGALARAVGKPIPVSRIARAMRHDELHTDLRALLDRIRHGVGRLELG
jgi:hypothetical protein